MRPAVNLVHQASYAEDFRKFRTDCMELIKILGVRWLVNQAPDKFSLIRALKVRVLDLGLTEEHPAKILKESVKMLQGDPADT